MNSRLRQTPCRCATADTEPPGRDASSTSRSLSATLQRRRRSTPVITSTRLPTTDLTPSPKVNKSPQHQPKLPTCKTALGGGSRRGEHPERHLAGYAGILQADAYGGFAGLYAATRAGGAVTEALCWAHARRKFFELADLARAGRAPSAPLAVEAVRQIDAIFAHERTINGRTAADRLAHRREHAASLVGAFEVWMKHERPKLSRHGEVARAMDYMLKRWPAFTRFLDDGRICLTTAERALRGVALGRKSWLFVGSDRGGIRAASMYTLIGTAKLNDIDPQAWLADVLERIASHPIQRLPELLPWHWLPAAAAFRRNAA